MEIIRDPVTGIAMRVNADGLAQVESLARNEQMHAALRHQDAYTMDIDGVTIGAGHYLAAIKNTDDKKLVIDKVTLWVNEFKDTAIVEASVGGTFAYSANGTAVVPSNCDAESGKAAVGSFYVNDGVGDLATIVVGDITGRFIFNITPLAWMKESGWVLPKNSCFFLKSEGGVTFRGYISMHYEEH